MQVERAFGVAAPANNSPAAGPNTNTGPQLTEVLEAKGLDMVRRDWSTLSKDTGNYVLQQILSGGWVDMGVCVCVWLFIRFRRLCVCFEGQRFLVLQQILSGGGGFCIKCVCVCICVCLCGVGVGNVLVLADASIRTQSHLHTLSHFAQPPPLTLSNQPTTTSHSQASPKLMVVLVVRVIAPPFAPSHTLSHFLPNTHLITLSNHLTHTQASPRLMLLRPCMRS